MRDIRKALKVVVPLVLILYLVTWWVVHENVQSTSVQVRAVSKDVYEIPVGADLREQIPLERIRYSPYSYDDGKLRTTLCFLQYEDTARFYSEEKSGIYNSSILWTNGQVLLTRGGMLRLDDQYYAVDYAKDLDVEIDLFLDWHEKDELDGFMLEVVTYAEQREISWFERLICDGVCFMTSFGDIRMATALFAVSVGAVVCILLGSIIEVVRDFRVLMTRKKT